MKLIVVAVDGSEGSIQALRWAVRRAEATGSIVRAVLCWEYPALALLPGGFGYAVPPPDEMESANADALTAYVDPVRRSTDVTIEEVVARGDPAHVILQHAPEADLVVVGTRGRGRLASVTLGSVSRKVAAAAPCPVAVVPQTEVDSTKPVVVGVDGSAGSVAALRWAAEATDGPIQAVHVFEYPFGPEYAVGNFSWEDPQELGWKLLEHTVTQAVGERPNLSLDVRRGDPREVLIEAGRDASMIVIGARGATGVEGWLLGSITTGVASHATVPVIVVPPEPA